VPLYPGVYSAMGLMLSDVKHDYVQSRMAAIDKASPEDVERMFGGLEARARDGLARDGFAPDRVSLQRALDMRYAGQGYEITVACALGPVEATTLADLRGRFDRQHQTMFGHMAVEETVEIVSYRVRGTGLTPPVAMERFAPAGTRLRDAERERRRVRFDGQDIDCPVYQRERIDVGLAVEGPAILDQLDCTTVILPGQVARIDAWKNLIVSEATHAR
jgi:N-methylhydantoinase A